MEKKYVNFCHLRGQIKKIFASEKVVKIYLETIKTTKAGQEIPTSHTVVYFDILNNVLDEGNWIDVEGELSLNTYKGEFKTQIIARKVTLVKDDLNENNDVYDPDNIPF